METHIFHEGLLPAGVSLDYESAIFNLPDFAISQGVFRPVSFYLLDGKRRKAVAQIHFHVADRLARSPFGAPFGSVECSERLQPAELYAFLAGIELHLKDIGVTDIHITNPPRAYAPEKWSLVETFLLNLGYVVAGAEVGTVIEVTDLPFAGVVRHAEKLRIQQGKRAGLSLHQCGTEQLREAYDFLAQRHGERGYKVSLTFEALERTVRVFPDRYPVFIVRHGQRVVAASISVRIQSNILYNFMVNHEREYNHLSPPILLMEGIYDYCRRSGIGLFDLGTSASDGQPNFPLLDFKVHIGGKPTSKFSFYKKTGS